MEVFKVTFNEGGERRRLWRQRRRWLLPQGSLTVTSALRSPPLLRRGASRDAAVADVRMVERNASGHINVLLTVWNLVLQSLSFSPSHLQLVMTIAGGEKGRVNQAVGGSSQWEL